MSVSFVLFSSASFPNYHHLKTSSFSFPLKHPTFCNTATHYFIFTSAKVQFPQIPHCDLSHLQIRLIQIPQKQHKPLHSIDMIPHTNSLINRMNIPQPPLPLRLIVPRRKPKYMRRQVPEKARVRVPRHDPRRGDYLWPVDRAVGACEDGEWCLWVWGGGCDGCGVEEFVVG